MTVMAGGIWALRTRDVHMSSKEPYVDVLPASIFIPYRRISVTSPCTWTLHTHSSHFPPKPESRAFISVSSCHNWIIRTHVCYSSQFFTLTHARTHARTSYSTWNLHTQVCNFPAYINLRTQVCMFPFCSTPTELPGNQFSDTSFSVTCILPVYFVN